MTELTISLDESVARDLETMAKEKLEPIGPFVVNVLKDAVKREEARRRLHQLVDSTPIALAPGWKWNREDLYDRPMLRGYKRPPVRGDGSPR